MTKGGLILLVLLLFSWAGGYFFWELYHKPALEQIKNQQNQIEELKIELQQAEVQRKAEEIEKEEIPPMPRENKNAWAKELNINLPYKVNAIDSQNLTLVEGVKIEIEDVTNIILGKTKEEIRKKEEVVTLPTEKIINLVYPYPIDFQKDDWLKIDLSWQVDEPIFYLKKIPPF